MQVNFGTEWREDKAHTDPDLETQLGAGSGGAGPIPPIAGQIHVAEVFTEFNLPLLDGLPFADQLAQLVPPVAVQRGPLVYCLESADLSGKDVVSLAHTRPS